VQLAVRRIDELHGVAIRFTRAVEHGGQGVGLPASAGRDDHVRRVVDDVRRERDAPGLELFDPIRNDQLGIVDGGYRTGKDRRRVAVGSHPEIEQVEARAVAELAHEHVGVGRCGRCRIVFAPHPEHVRGGNAERIEQRLARHAVIRFGVVRRHRAFVTEEEANAVPLHVAAPGRGGEQCVHRPRGRSAGQRNVGDLPVAQRRFDDADETVGCSLGQV